MSLCHTIHEHMDKEDWRPEAVQALIQIDQVGHSCCRARRCCFDSLKGWMQCQDFKTQSSFIYVILTTATASMASPHIGQLLLRLDFNSYFSAATSTGTS